MSSTSSSKDSSPNYRIEPYTPRHAAWPYSPSDFTRQDPTSDSSFYRSPRFVTHIDDAAIASLRQYYADVLPLKGRILDFCSSWISHYPPSVEAAASQQPRDDDAQGSLRITAMGMNKAELDANQCVNNGRLLIDLNETPDVASALRSANAVGDGDAERLDASTCVVSIDYLTDPVAVLRSLRDVTKRDGTVHLAVSNRCFPTKATRRWLRVGEEERLMMVGDYLHFAGWKNVEVVVLSDGKVGGGEQAGEGEQQGDVKASSLQGLMGWMGMNARDPIWVVRAVNE